jgi:Tfp pilus assembly ATPase PilU
MKISTVFRVGRQGFFTPADINRREFLKAGVILAVGATGLEMITRYAAMKTHRGEK